MSFLRCCCGYRPSPKHGIKAPQTQTRNQKLVAAAKRILDDYSPPVAATGEGNVTVVTPKSTPQKSVAEAAEFLKRFNL